MGDDGLALEGAILDQQPEGLVHALDRLAIELDGEGLAVLLPAAQVGDEWGGQGDRRLALLGGADAGAAAVPEAGVEVDEAAAERALEAGIEDGGLAGAGVGRD